MPHEIDSIGYPIDPLLKKLEFSLGHIAAKWRTAPPNSPERERIRDEYHNVIKELYALGWDAEVDVESELPKEYMPDEYKRRRPHLRRS